uniref:Mothers against decapentaplegic homolog n=1 Tax=Heligmosomoides polygyrus TaxID=6339 RepID=A0A8L8Q0U2_HELPZ
LAKRLKKAKYLDELAKAIMAEDRHSGSKSIRRNRSVFRSHHELKAVDNCRYPFSKKSDLVCINPYHYEPVHAKAPRELLVPLSPPAQGNFSVVQELIEYCEPECWMSITYYEEGKRIGDPFNVKSHYLLVDGYPCVAYFTSTSFCLGYFDVENRPVTVIDAPRRVSKCSHDSFCNSCGLKNVCQVYCECLSDAAIFVQSPNCNQRHGWHPTTVCKIPPNCNLKIFNNAEFAAQLAESVEKGYEAVFALTRLCTIRMSFVKGWGADYRRQTIDATPCWIEAHLNGPLLWIDRVLRSMGAPMVAHSSFT